jgi:hypothetical protein
MGVNHCRAPRVTAANAWLCGLLISAPRAPKRSDGGDAGGHALLSVLADCDYSTRIPYTLLYLEPAMSCCGSSRSEEEQNRPPPELPKQPVASQPGYQPSPAYGGPNEKPYGSTISPPPAVYQPAPHLGWNSTPVASPPPPSDVSHGQQAAFNPYGGFEPPSPPFQGGFGAPSPGIARPASIFDRAQSASPPRMNGATPGGSAFAQAVATEGRMSVAVDFGTTFSGVVRASAPATRKSPGLIVG